MMDIFNNKNAILAEKPKSFIIVIWLIIIACFILVIFLFKMKVYDNYQTKGYITCNDSCVLNTVIPSDLSYHEVFLNNQKVNLDIIEEEIKIDEENIVSYKELVFKLEGKYHDKEIVNLNFYYNKQRLIIKIKDKMF